MVRALGPLLQRSLECDPDLIELLSNINDYHQERNRMSYESRQRRAKTLAGGAGKTYRCHTRLLSICDCPLYRSSVINLRWSTTGSSAFVARLEKLVGRVLEPQKPGPKHASREEQMAEVRYCVPGIPESQAADPYARVGASLAVLLPLSQCAEKLASRRPSPAEARR